MKSRPPIETVAIYALIALLGLIFADFAILEIRPRMLPSQPPPARKLSPTSTPLADRGTYNIITSHNIFNADKKIAEPVGAKSGAVPIDAPPVPSQLPLVLLGTIVHIDPLRSVATINMKSKNNQMAFRVDHVIPDNLAKVTKIERNKVIFRNLATQRLEFIEIKDDAKINFGVTGFQPKANGEVKQVGDTDFELKSDDVKKLTGNLPELLQQARAIPVPGGFKVLDIQPGSIYERLGIKPNDIINGVNGEVIDTPAKAMDAYNGLRNSPNISLQIERNGQRQNLNYNIK
jgi:general secretion pathway protein C